MRHSSRMKSLIEKLAKENGADLTKIGTHFRVRSPGFMDLVVEVIGKDKVSVTHYYEQNGEPCQDPEIVFWVCPINSNWYPIEWTTPPFMIFGKVAGGYQKVLWLNDDQTGWEKARVKAQSELAKFANQWSTNLRRQGFI